MTAIEIGHAVATGYVAIWALYLLLLPLLGRLWRPRKREGKRCADTEWPTTAVIVPAYNMGPVITRCVRSLRACHYAEELVEVYVVADHCSDDTAERARAAGAIVLTRNDGPRGKTYTLAWAFEALTTRDVTPDLYLIVDATVQVEAHFLTAMALRWQQGEDIIRAISW
jgi:cellulose synthase/poly-beta-1,6-N-acetylglucosamine synthase-like glycosyltransferase